MSELHPPPPLPPPPPEWPPRGWYSDPSGQPLVRWWDGQAWTEHTSTFEFLQQPQGQFSNVSGSLAGWWRRAGGNLLDALILGVPNFALGALLGTVQLSSTTSAVTTHLPAHILLAVIALVANLAYPAWLLANKGQTVGMMAVGIKLLDRPTGQPSAWPQVRTRVIAEFLLFSVWSETYGVLNFSIHHASRFAAPAVPFIILAIVMGLTTYLWPLGSPLNQTLHDKIADTVVVRV
jgi:uncharacterized RDD family membrane protein YckC